MRKVALTVNQKNLTRRYLVWCYKTTKEDLDRIERYFTQIVVDDYILNLLRQSNENKKSGLDFKKLVDGFEVYRHKKEEKVMTQKFIDAKNKILQPQYVYLQKRFSAIEQAIKQFLGIAELKKISALYEQEMTSRILQARDHS